MKKRFAAVLTVEAAFIMPLVIFIIVLLIQYSLILYDRVVSRSLLQEELAKALELCEGKEAKGYDFSALSKQRLFFNNTDDCLKNTEKELMDMLNNSLLFSTVGSVKIEKNLTGITAKINVKHRQMLPVILKQKTSASLYISEELGLFNRENKTRLATALVETLSNYTFSMEE